MSHSMSTFSRGILPNFHISAQSEPENPDTEEQTRQLLRQFSAFSTRPQVVITQKSDKDGAAPRSEPLPILSEAYEDYSPSPPSLPAYRPALATSNHSRPISPQEGNRVSPRAQRSPSNIPPVSPVNSSNLSPPPGRISRQRSLRESVVITNANKSDETLNPTISPVESNSIRRSSRARAQPANYYARLRIGSEERELTTRESSTPEELKSVSYPPIRPQEPSPVRPRRTTRGFLCGRELGGKQVDMEMMSDLKPWKSWKGASGDILALTWSPDGTRFAAGAAAKIDSLNMQYNRRINFVLGNVHNSRLKEIPDHWIARPDALSVDDPRLYMTVTDMQWAGDRLYTASYDKTVKIWDTTSSNGISCMRSLPHDSRVELTAVSSFNPNILATGTDVITIWDTDDLDNLTSATMPIDRPNALLASTTLAWGNSPATKEFLAGGMCEIGDDLTYKGCLGLWRAREGGFETIKVSKNSQNIHDLKWHSSLPQFATASPEDPHDARMKGIGAGTKSIVRVFNIDANMRVRPDMEFSCPALDVNQVTFCPADGRYISASCTDGTTYVWDNRKGDRILHRLYHGVPINPIAHDRSREAADAGVNVALWGSSANQFYTGASDGVLKRWDIRRSSEDALLENVATFQDEIMRGSFNHDQSHLLIGDSGGAVHVLSSGPCGDPEVTDFQFEHAPELSTNFGNEDDYGAVMFQIDEPLPPKPGRICSPDCSLSARTAKKRRREEHRRIKAELYEDLEPPPDEAHGEFDETDARAPIEIKTEGSNCTNEVIEISGEESSANEDDEDEFNEMTEELVSSRSQTERRRMRKRKKRRLQRPQPIIRNTDCVDLTMDCDSDNPDPLDMGPIKEALMEALEDDFWFPDSGDVDPNITAPSA